MNKTVYKLCLFAFKYVPILCSLFLMLHCLALWCDYHVYFMGVVFGGSLFSTVTMFAASYAFQFCRLHRCFILYNFTISCCINYQAAYGFGDLRPILHGVMFATGMILFAMLIYKKGKICGGI